MQPGTNLIQPGILQDCILKMQKVGQEAQAKMVVIYIKEDIDLFVEENFPHSVNEDLQKISRDQKRALRSIAEQIKNVKSPTDKTLPNILLLCHLETSKEDLREAGEREKESIGRFLLDKLAAPDVIEDFLELPFPEEDHRKKAWKKELEERGPYKEEIDIDDLAKRSDGMYPGRIRRISHDAKNIAVSRGEDKISLEDIFLAGKNQFQNDEAEEETIDPSKLQNFYLTLPNFKGNIPESISNAFLKFKYRNHFEKNGVSGPTGLLLHGDPGNGKSILIKAIIEMLNCPYLRLDCSLYSQKYIGAGATILRRDNRALQALQHSYPYASRIAVPMDEGEGIIKKIDINKENSVGLTATRNVFLEMMDKFKLQAKERIIVKHLREKIERDQITPKDKKELERQLKKSRVSLPLKELFEKQSEEGKLSPEVKEKLKKQLNRRLREIGPPITFLISTNFKPSKLDPASIRRGRIDVVAEIGYPDEVSKAEILAHHLSNYQLEKDFNVNEFIQQALMSQKLKIKTSGADLASIAEEAGFEAAKECRAINKSHLQQALETLKKEQRSRRR